METMHVFLVPETCIRVYHATSSETWKQTPEPAHTSSEAGSNGRQGAHIRAQGTVPCKAVVIEKERKAECEIYACNNTH